jgi:hypothetical protein
LIVADDVPHAVRGAFLEAGLVVLSAAQADIELGLGGRVSGTE